MGTQSFGGFGGAFIDKTILLEEECVVEGKAEGCEFSPLFGGLMFPMHRRAESMGGSSRRLTSSTGNDGSGDVRDSVHDGSVFVSSNLFALLVGRMQYDLQSTLSD